jgi:hypothetical protein
MIHVLEGRLALEMRGNGGVVLLNCLDAHESCTLRVTPDPSCYDTSWHPATARHFASLFQDVLGSRRGLVFLIIIISLARKIFRSFVFVGRAKLSEMMMMRKTRPRRLPRTSKQFNRTTPPFPLISKASLVFVGRAKLKKRNTS